MKNKYFKKVLSVFMAAVTMLTMLGGIGLKASAAGEQTAVYIVEFPRSGDANSGANWGNSTMNFMNGWSMPALRTLHMRAIGSYTGQVCYCVEPGNSQHSGDRFTSRDDSYWDNFPSNGSLSGDEIKMFIGRILTYGYNGNMSVSWYSQNSGDLQNMSHALATQILIWETVVGERDSSFNKVSTGGKNAIWDMMSTSNPLYSTTRSYYDSMVSNVRKHTKVPSFFARSTGRADEIELKWDGEKYSATLTDSNGVVGNYSYSVNATGFSFDVSGNKLTISTTNPPKDSVTITATKKNATRGGFVTWSDGSTGNQGSLQDIITYAQSVSDPVKGYLKAKVSLGSIKVVKDSEDNVLKDLTFIIEGNGFTYTVKTGADGVVQQNDLIPGTYTVTEMNYERYEPQAVQRVTVNSGQITTVNFSNKLKKGDLTVTKTSEDGFVEGVKFHLYGTSLGNIKVDEYATTNADGVAEFKDIPIGAQFTLEEVETAIRYVVPAKQNAVINWNEVTEQTMHNALKKFSVVVTKSDVDTGTAQGDGSLAGATYGIFKGETIVDSYTTDINGQFTTEYYVCDDDWTIRELSPSEGYLLDSAVYKVGSEPQLYTIEYNTTTVDVVEEAIMGNIAIIKHADDGETQVETPEPNAEFQIYLKSAGSFDVSKDTEKDVIKTDENGFAQSKDMPYGIYTVHQTVGKEGTNLMPDFDVYISNDGETYRYIINNSIFKSFIKIIKKDAESGNTIPLAGSAFQLYDPDGNKIEMTFTYPEVTTIDTFYTNKEGYLITPESLPYGTGYSIQEVQAPYGYVLNTDRVYFDVSAYNSSEDSGVTVIEVIKNNLAQKGVINIKKTGEVFASVTQANGVYQPVYEVQGLAGAVYEIKAVEDVYTQDGTLRATAGEIVDTVTTGQDGVTVSKELYLGKYTVTEITAPQGMVVNTDVHEIELVYAGQEVEIVQNDTGFYNDRQKVEFNVLKEMEVDEDYGVGNNGEVTEVVFGLFANEELTAADGTTIPWYGLIEIAHTDENGNCVFTSDMPLGSYLVKELDTHNSYMEDWREYLVAFDYNGQEIERVYVTANDSKPLFNELYRGEINGIKIDEDGFPLAGAIIGIFKSEEGPFNYDTAIATVQSDKNGEYTFKDVPVGTWYIKEIEAPKGYNIDENVYAVIVEKELPVPVAVENLEEGSETFEVTDEPTPTPEPTETPDTEDEFFMYDVVIRDTYIKGNVELTKVDADYPENKLTGAEFEIWYDTNENKELDGEDMLVDKMEELSDGVYRYNDLYYGGYFVKETKAPTGFILDETARYFEITQHGVTVNVETGAGKGFINNAQKGKILILKSSDDGKREGFKFKVEGTDITGNVYSETFTTDSKGEIHISGLRLGTYKVSEVKNDANKKYIIPGDKTVTVEVGNTAIVNFHNKLKPSTPDIPLTGDTTNPTLWGAVALGSLAAAAVTGYLTFRKRKDTDSEE